MYRPLQLRALSTAITALILQPTVEAQLNSMPTDGSLPSTMIERFEESDSYAMLMRIPTTDPSESIEARVVFENSATPKSVSINWTATKIVNGEKLVVKVDQVETVGYLPTAVCPEKTTAARLFVAGWAPRSKTCIVEEWSLATAALGTTIHPVSGAASISFSPPQIEKTQVLLRSDLAAMESMAHHPISQELLLLEHGPESVIHRLGLAPDGVPLTAFARATDFPELAEARDLRVRSHNSAEYLLGVLDVPVWAGGLSSSYVVFWDVDEDGVFETPPTIMNEKMLAMTLPGSGWKEVP